MSADTLTQIASRADFHDAIRAALAMAAEHGASEIFLVDPHFHDWPLNERGIIESLGRWALSRRRIVVFAHDFDEMARRAPRFAAWRASGRTSCSAAPTPSWRPTRCRPFFSCPDWSRCACWTAFAIAARCRAGRPITSNVARRLTRFCNDPSKPFLPQPSVSREST